MGNGCQSRCRGRRAIVLESNTYLNHAGTSWPKPQPVYDAVLAATQTDPSRWTDLFYESFNTVAQFFHVQSSRLVLTPGCTSALNLAIMDQNWESGDRIITSSFEHHALYRNLTKLQLQGVDIVEVPPTIDSVFDLEFAEKELKSGKIKLVAVTAACNVTGAILPLDAIIQLAQKYGAKVLIDGAQIAGWWDVDLVELGADMFTFAGHKGLQAPWGIGGLYVAEHIKMSCPSATCEIGTKIHSDFDVKPGYCDAGSVDLIALAGLAAGCQWLSQSNNQSRLSNSRELAKKFTRIMCGVSGAEIIHDFDFQNKMPTIAVNFGAENQRIVEKLKSNHVQVSSGFQCAPIAHKTLGTTEHGVIRFSIGPNQSDIDFDLVLKAIS